MKTFLRYIQRTLPFLLLFLLLSYPLPCWSQNPEDQPLADNAPTLPQRSATATLPEDAPLRDDAPTLDAPPPHISTAQQMTSETAVFPHEHSHGRDENPGDSNKGYVHAWWDIIGSFSGPEHAFMREALVSGLFVALLCGYLGLFVVMKRIVFVSVALAEMSSAGVAAGLLVGLSPSWGAAIFTLLGVFFFSSKLSPRRIPQESTIGMAYCLAGALGLLLLASNASGEGDLLTLLQGNILTGTSEETWQIAGAFTLVILLHLVARKEFTTVSFDRDLATIQGLNANLCEFLLFLSLGVVIALSVRAVGVLLTTAFLVVPATAALMLTQRLRNARLLAPLLAVWTVPLGLHCSLLSDSLPPSPIIVALLFLPLLVSLVSHGARRT